MSSHTKSRVRESKRENRKREQRVLGMLFLVIERKSFVHSAQAGTINNYNSIRYKGSTVIRALSGIKRPATQQT